MNRHFSNSPFACGYKLILFLIFTQAVFTVAAQQWALPRVSVTSLRSEPRHSAEQVSQVVMGTPLKIMAINGDWWKVQTPEGYLGFVRNNTLTGLSDKEMEQWRTLSRGVVMSDRTIFAYLRPTDTSDRLTDLVNGSILQIIAHPDSTSMTGIRLPDGRIGFIDNQYIIPIEEWASQAWDPEFMHLYARRFMGAPYVWGGTSLNGMDCSGLTQICAYRQGIMLPRDASQQVNVGTPIDKSDFSKFEPGDLIFFGNVNTGKVNHVAISIGNGDYIHSSGRVRVSTLRPGHPAYENPGLIGVRRLDPATRAKLSLLHHPWYFPNQRIVGPLAAPWSSRE